MLDSNALQCSIVLLCRIATCCDAWRCALSVLVVNSATCGAIPLHMAVVAALLENKKWNMRILHVQLLLHLQFLLPQRSLIERNLPQWGGSRCPPMERV